jgi:hypothetical protein
MLREKALLGSFLTAMYRRPSKVISN